MIRDDLCFRPDPLSSAPLIQPKLVFLRPVEETGVLSVEYRPFPTLSGSKRPQGLLA